MRRNKEINYGLSGELGDRIYKLNLTLLKKEQNKRANKDMEDNAELIDKIIREEYCLYNKSVFGEAYREHRVNINNYQSGWYNKLIGLDYTLLITMTLPTKNIQGIEKTRKCEEAFERYKKLVGSFECHLYGKNWRRHPLHFIGCMDRGESSFWHLHLLIPRYNNEDEVGLVRKVCEGVRWLIDEFDLEHDSIDVRYVYDKEGICLFFVKELKCYSNSETEERSGMFYLSTMFKGVKRGYMKSNFLDELYPNSPNSKS